MMNKVIRTLHPEIRVLDAKQGLVEYVASDETVDSYREVIRADGWRFNHFAKNAPFVDSHEYTRIENMLGKVVDFKVAGRKLVETVKWAIDVAENKIAQLGWKMTEAGYLKAVSVGFWPIKTVTQHSDTKGFTEQLQDLGLPADASVRAIYTEQEQIELSAVVIGANPNALARSYKAGVLSDADLDLISSEMVNRTSGTPAVHDEQAGVQRARQRMTFLERLHTIQKQL
jgi:hypothetical protein